MAVIYSHILSVFMCRSNNGFAIISARCADQAILKDKNNDCDIISVCIMCRSSNDCDIISVRCADQAMTVI